MTTFRNMVEDILEKSGYKLKHKYIDQIYKAINDSGITKRIYNDEHWQGYNEILRKLDELGFEVITGPANDQLHSNGYSIDGKEKCWTVNLKKDEVEINGNIRAFAAGSVEYPFDKYDITLTLW